MSNSKRRFHNDTHTVVSSFQVGKSWEKDGREILGTVLDGGLCYSARVLYIYRDCARVQTITMCTSGVYVKTFNPTNSCRRGESNRIEVEICGKSTHE